MADDNKFNQTGLLYLIKSDFQRYIQTYALRGQPFSKTKVFWESVLFKAGFQAAVFYRISHWLYKKKHIYLAWFVTRMNSFFTGAEIEFNASIGPGLLIPHPVGIVIGRGSVIGSDVTIFQGVSLAVTSWHPDLIKKFPKVGNNCYLFTNSVILGNISIGDNCVVAAQALVNRDMPDGSLAIGVPITIQEKKGQALIASWQ